ncbi:MULTISPECIES: hypothetical protein [unclassified Microcystis]|nr:MULTISPECIES: hypothetical protein [unclassified Microcystis]
MRAETHYLSSIQMRYIEQRLTDNPLLIIVLGVFRPPSLPPGKSP